MYSIKDIYPNFAAVGTTDLTTPEAAEQATLAQSDVPFQGAAVSNKQRANIWTGLLLVFLLVFVFHVAK